MQGFGDVAGAELERQNVGTGRTGVLARMRRLCDTRTT